MAEWHDIAEEPVPNTVFDVLAKCWDASMDRFLVKRFTDCIQVNGVVMWGDPFQPFSCPNRTIRTLTDYGFRPTHWTHIPDAPADGSGGAV